MTHYDVGKSRGWFLSKTVSTKQDVLSVYVTNVRQPDLQISCSINISKNTWIWLCKNTSYPLNFVKPSEKKNLFPVFCFAASTNLDLRFSLALCDKEKQFRQTRRERVMLGIKKLLDMEKPRFLPSSPEEVGRVSHTHTHTPFSFSGDHHHVLVYDRLPLMLALKPTHPISLQPLISPESYAVICCSHCRSQSRSKALLHPVFHLAAFFK